MFISVELRERIAGQARNRCGYCRSAEKVTGVPLEIDHLIPLSAGGSSREENLWLACRRCNSFKRSQTHALDVVTGQGVRLFNPRKQQWNRHFEWSQDGTRIIGKTACGRATVLALQMNNDLIVDARGSWVNVGWHPPKD
mgnify:CR=1 FL=1